AIDEVGGTDGTVLVPKGAYMVDASLDPQERDDAQTVRRCDSQSDFPNDSKKYSVLSISGVSNVAITGGTLEGERDQHKGEKGEWGMGIHIDDDASHIVINGVTARKMWGDGFYVQGASDVKFCSVIADGNRRQGLSIISADRVIVLNSIFKNTQGTRPSAGIDFEPDDADQKVTDVRIERSQFLDNAGPGILIAGKRGAVAKVELTGNVLK